MEAPRRHIIGVQGARMYYNLTSIHGVLRSAPFGDRRRAPLVRHWRECVLWMRLYGYPIRLVSYHQWLRQLDRETEPTAAADGPHSLRALRAFFLNRPAGAQGLTLPEIHEETRRARATDERTREADPTLAANCPPLDATLLDTCFRAFVGSGIWEVLREIT